VLHELARLDAVRRYEILDTPSDGAFDRITSLAARLLDVPIAIVSIVDEDRIWFKSAHGLDVDEIDRGPGLCASAILRYEPTVIPDATLDPVALSNPLVAGEFGLRFYAAIPLTTSDGHNLGTLCVIDQEPRNLEDRELAILDDLAGLVIHELELRLAARTAVSRQTALRQEAVEQKEYAAKLAETLQQSLLPPSLPSFPGVELAARYRPLDRSEVGGDFYDLFPLPDDSLGIVIGDVCGKGPDAASLTAAARYTMRAAALEHESPSAALHAVNHALLLQAAEAAPFCTLIYARLRRRPGGLDVVMASGGHPLPCIVRTDGEVERLGVHGTLVGILPEVRFTDATATLAPGETLVLFTDGLTETPARRWQRAQQLGAEGVEDLLRGMHSKQPDEIARRLQEAAWPPRDDLAILVARAT
jgi:sigma-B regulation protein RsbU (phosphoserine phosphatase)